MDAAIVKLSSKGQLVLPTEMKNNLRLSKGSKIILIQQGNALVMKSVDNISHNLEDEILDMALASKGWEQLESKKSKKVSKVKFLKELDSW